MPFLSAAARKSTESGETLTAVHEVDDAVAEFHSVMTPLAHIRGVAFFGTKTERVDADAGGGGDGSKDNFTTSSGNAPFAGAPGSAALWLPHHDLAQLAPACHKAEVDTMEELLYMATDRKLRMNKQ